MRIAFLKFHITSKSNSSIVSLACMHVHDIHFDDVHLSEVWDSKRLKQNCVRFVFVKWDARRVLHASCQRKITIQRRWEHRVNTSCNSCISCESWKSNTRIARDFTQENSNSLLTSSWTRHVTLQSRINFTCSALSICSINDTTIDSCWKRSARKARWTVSIKHNKLSANEKSRLR